MFIDLELIFIVFGYKIYSKEKTFPPRKKNIFSMRQKETEPVKAPFLFCIVE